MKIVVSDTGTGRAYNLELDERKVGSLLGKKIGDEIDASPIGLTGYKIKITGGSDKDGFPMRHDIHSRGRPKILLSQGPGYKPKAKGIKKRKRVRGNIITPDILQVNAKIVKKGKKGIEEQLGGLLGEEKEGEVKEEAKKVKEEGIEAKKEPMKKEGLEKVEKKEKKESIEKEKGKIEEKKKQGEMKEEKKEAMKKEQPAKADKSAVKESGQKKESESNIAKKEKTSADSKGEG